MEESPEPHAADREPNSILPVLVLPYWIRPAVVFGFTLAGIAGGPFLAMMALALADALEPADRVFGF
jgi:hypothetical protein